MAKPTRYTDDLIKEYTEKGYWEPVTISGLWDRHAEEFPQMIELNFVQSDSIQSDAALGGI